MKNNLVQKVLSMVLVAAFVFTMATPTITVQAVTNEGPYAGQIIAYNGSGDGPHKVEICHAPPGHEGEKLVFNEVDASSIISGRGHDEHESHIYDIIPPFTYYTDREETVTEDFAGLNWDGDNITLYNEGCGPEEETVQVTIVKYLDGELATPATADGASFDMESSWSDSNSMNAGSGSFALSSTGFNNTNAYYATTSEMEAGSNYSVEEVMGDGVAEDCTDPDTEYALEGYSVGNSLVDAEDNDVTSTANLTDIQDDQFVIVRNLVCDETPGSDNTVQVTINKYIDGQMATTATANSTSFAFSSSWNDVGGAGVGNGTFNLNSANGYTIATSEMNLGSTYSVSETMNGQVATNCDGSEPFVLGGYSVGDNTAAALAAPITLTAPNITNIQSDKVVIVRNVTCPDVAGDNNITVSIVKYLDGQLATDTTANNATFSFVTTYNDDGAGGIGAGTNDPFTLDATNDYGTSTINFKPGVDYTFNEVMNSVTATNCDGNEPYALAGYSVGDTLVGATQAASTLTNPNFDELNSDKFVVVRNITCTVTPAPADTVNVTIVKYLDGQVASAATTGGDSFSMASSWSNTGTSSDGSGTYTLGTTGFNNPNAYYATTSEMNVGANYTTNEVFGNGVAANCDVDGAEYALVGYSVGADLNDPAINASTLTAPNLTNLQQDQTIIVRNIRCGDVLGDDDIVCTDAPVSLVSGSNTIFRGYTTSTPTDMSNAAQYSSVNSASVAVDSTGFPGAYDSVEADADLTGATFISNSTTQPSAIDEGNGLGTETSYRLFSQTFTVPSTAVNISPTTLYFAGDNNVTVFLDNVQIGNSTFNSVGQATLPTLVAGQTYTLQFAVRNDGLSNADNPSDGDYNPTGLIYKLNLDFDCTAPVVGGDDNNNNSNNGGGSSGSRRNNNDDDEGSVLGDTDFGPGLQMPNSGLHFPSGGVVLGDSTNTPSDTGGSPDQGRVLGDNDRLPRTGAATSILWALMAIAGTIVLSRSIASKMKAQF